MTNCSKVYFLNEAVANEYIEKLHKTSVRKYKPVRAYLCEKCLTWHLTKIEASDTSKQARIIMMHERRIKNLLLKVTHLESEIERLTKKKK